MAFQSFARTVLAFIAFTIATLAGTAHAQIITSSPTVSYSSPQLQMGELKSAWFPGGSCYIERTPHTPEMVTFTTTVVEHMTASMIRSCVSQARKRPWKKVAPTIPSVDTMREARTDNMACVIAGVVNTPLIYQVRFTSLDFTGEDREINDCMRMALESKDRVPPPIPMGRGTLSL